MIIWDLVCDRFVDLPDKFRVELPLWLGSCFLR